MKIVTTKQWKDSVVAIKKYKDQIVFVCRTEQWEYTARLGKLSATGSSSQSAELNLLRLIVFGDQREPIEKRSMSETTKKG